MKIKSMLGIALLILASANLMANSQVIEINKTPVFKIIPQFGVTKLNSNYLNYNSTINTGVALDFMVNSHFSLGLNFNYSLFELYNGYYNSNQGLDLKQYNIGLQSKFFIISEGLIRPFIGMGVSYTINNLDYADDFQNYGNGHNNQGYTFGAIAGSIMLGSEVRFSENVGLVLDFKYSRNIASGFGQMMGNQNYYNGFISPEMQTVEYDLDNANYTSAGIGLVISI